MKAEYARAVRTELPWERPRCPAGDAADVVGCAESESGHPRRRNAADPGRYDVCGPRGGGDREESGAGCAGDDAEN